MAQQIPKVVNAMKEILEEAGLHPDPLWRQAVNQQTPEVTHCAVPLTRQ